MMATNSTAEPPPEIAAVYDAETEPESESQSLFQELDDGARVLKKTPSVIVMANDESMAALDVDDDPATAPQTASGPSQQFVPSSQQPAIRSRDSFPALENAFTGLNKSSLNEGAEEYEPASQILELPTEDHSSLPRSQREPTPVKLPPSDSEDSSDDEEEGEKEEKEEKEEDQKYDKVPLEHQSKGRKSTTKAAVKESFNCFDLSGTTTQSLEDECRTLGDTPMVLGTPRPTPREEKVQEEESKPINVQTGVEEEEEVDANPIEEQSIAKGKAEALAPPKDTHDEVSNSDAIGDKDNDLPRRVADSGLSQSSQPMFATPRSQAFHTDNNIKANSIDSTAVPVIVNPDSPKSHLSADDEASPSEPLTGDMTLVVSHDDVSTDDSNSNLKSPHKGSKLALNSSPLSEQRDRTALKDQSSERVEQDGQKNTIYSSNSTNLGREALTEIKTIETVSDPETSKKGVTVAHQISEKQGSIHASEPNLSINLFACTQTTPDVDDKVEGSTNKNDQDDPKRNKPKVQRQNSGSLSLQLSQSQAEDENVPKESQSSWVLELSQSQAARVASPSILSTTPVKSDKSKSLSSEKATNALQILHTNEIQESHPQVTSGKKVINATNMPETNKFSWLKAPSLRKQSAHDEKVKHSDHESKCDNVDEENINKESGAEPRSQSEAVESSLFTEEICALENEALDVNLTNQNQTRTRALKNPEDFKSFGRRWKRYREAEAAAAVAAEGKSEDESEEKTELVVENKDASTAQKVVTELEKENNITAESENAMPDKSTPEVNHDRGKRAQDTITSNHRTEGCGDSFSRNNENVLSDQESRRRSSPGKGSNLPKFPRSSPAKQQKRCVNDNVNRSQSSNVARERGASDAKSLSDKCRDIASIKSRAPSKQVATPKNLHAEVDFSIPRPSTFSQKRTQQPGKASKLSESDKRQRLDAHAQAVEYQQEQPAFAVPKILPKVTSKKFGKDLVKKNRKSLDVGRGKVGKKFTLQNIKDPNYQWVKKTTIIEKKYSMTITKTVRKTYYNGDQSTAKISTDVVTSPKQLIEENKSEKTTLLMDPLKSIPWITPHKDFDSKRNSQKKKNTSKTGSGASSTPASPASPASPAVPVSIVLSNSKEGECSASLRTPLMRDDEVWGRFSDGIWYCARYDKEIKNGHKVYFYDQPKKAITIAKHHVHKHFAIRKIPIGTHAWVYVDNLEANGDIVDLNPCEVLGHEGSDEVEVSLLDIDGSQAIGSAGREIKVHYRKLGLEDEVFRSITSKIDSSLRSAQRSKKRRSIDSLAESPSPIAVRGKRQRLESVPMKAKSPMPSTSTKEDLYDGMLFYGYTFLLTALGLDKQKMKGAKRKIKTLRGEIGSSQSGTMWNLTDRHIVVADENEPRFRRTAKFLHGVVQGIPIVTLKWLERIYAQEIANPSPPSLAWDIFEDIRESELLNVPRNNLKGEKIASVTQDMTFYITQEPNIEFWKEVFTVSGAKILDEATFSSYGDQTHKCDGVLTINDEMALDAFTADMVQKHDLNVYTCAYVIDSIRWNLHDNW